MLFLISLAPLVQLVEQHGNDPKFEGTNPATIPNNSLYYKTIMIVIMMIISDATVWSVTYDHNWQHKQRQELARIINYDCNCSFLVLATVITIINYDRKTFIVQATGKMGKNKNVYI